MTRSTSLGFESQCGVPSGPTVQEGKADFWKRSGALCYGRRVGRQARLQGGRTTLNLDATLKRRAVLFALRAGVTLTELIEHGLRLALASEPPTPGQKKSRRIAPPAP